MPDVTFSHADMTRALDRSNAWRAEAERLQAENARLRSLHLSNCATMEATILRLEKLGKTASELRLAVKETRLELKGGEAIEAEIRAMLPQELRRT